MNDFPIKLDMATPRWGGCCVW